MPNFFRPNISGPMGTRAVALWLRESKMKNFYGIGHGLRLGPQLRSTYSNPRSKRAKKNFIGAVYSPIGTKDFSTYITKIRQAGADACYIVHGRATTTTRSCRSRANTDCATRCSC